MKPLVFGDTIYEQGLTIFDFRSLLQERERIRCDRCGSWRTWRDTSTALSIVSCNVRKEDVTLAKGI